ncbi:MAG: glycoside hydrolase family 95 protein [Clostridiales bacterium]|jgi:alpha-L-fucosidase 2|nr:glycoside hydrolase family 95 protein [Clostridiales bacterium]
MDTSAVLWYESSAIDFNSALPVGNGRIGGMVYGRVEEELINLNEESIWSGGKRYRINPDAKDNLENVRKLLFDGKIKEAEDLAMKTMTGVGPDSRHYLPLGDLHISMKNVGNYEDYKRYLDLRNAICTTEFVVDGVRYVREVFVSYPDDVLVINIKADKPNSINIFSRLDRAYNLYDDNRPYNSNTLILTAGSGSADGIFFSAVLSAASKGGKIYTLGGSLYVDNADEVTLVLGVQTGYRMGDYITGTLNDVQNALSCEYSELKSRHIEDYQELFNRTSFSLCDNSEGESKSPTDERILRLTNNGFGEADQGSVKYDNKLIELYFNYGRYLMIAASRRGTLPMNLQGIWNKDMQPAWGSRYCLNINTEMNYWCAESCNLSECHLPLIEHIEKIREDGRKTAREMYNCRGFVCHHNTDIWGDTAPQDIYAPASIWPMGAAWLCLHIFEHYEYTQDLNFLAEKYDTIKEAAEFFVDFLVEDSNGRLVTCPSVSPENSYITDDGVKASLCVGPAIDSQIIKALFNCVIKSAEILGKDKVFADKLKGMIEKLPKIEVGKYGHIKEWLEDYSDFEAGHRHISQLFALYPSNEITPDNPVLAKAARATLIRRLVHGGGHTGWSRAWIINFWARLQDGQMVFENIQKLLANSTNNNLLASHPPFEIDGNFGGVAGIVEALMQSHNGMIYLLPALPREWKCGEINGLRARGGFEVSIKWDENRLTSAEILSLNGNSFKLKTNVDADVFCNEVLIGTSMSDEGLFISTKVGEKYIVNYRG